MNRREFVNALGVSATVSAMGIRALAAETATVPLYVRGLVMISIEDSEYLRLAFPKAAGHKGAITWQPVQGKKQSAAIKGRGIVQTSATGGRPPIQAPELVRVSELYGDGVRSKFEGCPAVISIPYAAITSFTTHEVTGGRYTFVRADNDQEVATFRPRKIAESIRLELRSDSVLKVNDGKLSLNVGGQKEIWTEFGPTGQMSGEFSEHFVHYLAHLVRTNEQDYEVVPKKLSGSNTTPTVGNQFMWPITWCDPILVG